MTEATTRPTLGVHDLIVHRRDRPILSDVDVVVEAGELVVVVGPSGAGKSTLLSVLSGDLNATTGQPSLLDRPLSSWTPASLARHRAVLPQSSSLNFPFPVLDVVMMGRTPYSGSSQARGERLVALDALDRAGVGHLADRDYITLSGGERQRVQFARVLAQVDATRRDPRFLLLDEPTASLDVSHAWSVLRVARELTNCGVGVFCVLHDLNLAARFADRILLLADGRLRAAGSPRQVLTPALIHEFFGVVVDVIDHPSADAPLVVVRGDSSTPPRQQESPS